MLFAAALLLVTDVTAQKCTRLAKTPPMGWNIWNKFHCDVSETLIMQTADAMVSSGMKDAGYEYFVMVDSVMNTRMPARMPGTELIT